MGADILGTIVTVTQPVLFAKEKAGSGNLVYLFIAVIIYVLQRK